MTGITQRAASGPALAAILLTLLAVAIAATGCQGEAAEQDGLPVVVSVLPQAYFVQRLGGDHVTAMVLVGPQDSPETYQVSPRQMATLGQARVWFQIGMAFEEQLGPRIKDNFPNLRLIRTQQNVRLRRMETELDAPLRQTGQAEHDHHDDDECEDDHDGHDHGTYDPHIWLDPKLVKLQATAIAEGLIAADPEQREAYERNLAEFHGELDALDAELRQILAPVAGKRMLVAHPAFGYFTDAYGLRQVSAEVEGKEPTGRQLAALQELAREHGIRTMFVQPQFSARVANVLAQRIDGRVVNLDPLAGGNYAENMRLMARTIAEALADEQPNTAPPAPSAPPLAAEVGQ